MKPNKTNGLTDEQRERRCTGKHRWADELSARAGAIFALEQYKKADALYVYRCPLCKGWHLTRSKQAGQEPAAVRQPAEYFEVFE